MSDPNQPSTPPGWYPDGQGGQRWWDGTQWTEHTQPPAGGAPAAPAAPSAPAAPAAPSAPGADLPTQVAPNRAAGYGQPGAQQPGAPQQPQQPQQPHQPPQGVYGAPAGGYGQPAGQPGYGQQQPFGAGPAGGSSSGGGNGKLIAIIGGGIGALLLVVILVVVLFKVIGGGSPEDVAKDYLGARFEGDYSKECELLSKDAQKEFLEFNDADDCDEYAENSEDNEEEFAEDYEDEYGESFDDIRGDVDYEVEITELKEKGDDEAVAEYKETFEYTGDNDDVLEDFFDGEEKNTDEGSIKLVKEDGDWKVDEE